LKIEENIDKNDLVKLQRVPVQKSDGKYLFIARIKGLLIIEDIIKNCLRWIK